MPVILPTADELAQLDWHKRDRAVRAARNLLRAYGDAVEPVAPAKRYRLTDAQRAEREWAWGEAVRAEARRLAGETADA